MKMACASVLDMERTISSGSSRTSAILDFPRTNPPFIRRAFHCVYMQNTLSPPRSYQQLVHDDAEVPTNFSNIYQKFKNEDKIILCV